MADIFGAAQDLLGGFSSFLSGSAAAKGSKAAAAAYKKAADLTELATSLKAAAATRQVYRVIGGARADVAANGLAQSGSAEDVIRASAREGSLARSLIETQGAIDYASLIGQSQAAEAAAQAQKSGGTGGLLGGIIGAIGSIFSDDRLKTDIVLMRRREDGLGVYSFRYNWDTDQYYMGVLVSEVRELYPDAVSVDEQGVYAVDYAAIGAEFITMQRDN